MLQLGNCKREQLRHTLLQAYERDRNTVFRLYFWGAGFRTSSDTQIFGPEFKFPVYGSYLIQITHWGICEVMAITAGCCLMSLYPFSMWGTSKSRFAFEIFLNECFDPQLFDPGIPECDRQAKARESNGCQSRSLMFRRSQKGSAGVSELRAGIQPNAWLPTGKQWMHHRQWISHWQVLRAIPPVSKIRFSRRSGALG
jgi:hypothetical protein